MTLETHLNAVLKHLMADNRSSAISAEQLIPTLDLTLLEENPSDEALQQLNQLAEKNQLAAICVQIPYLAHFNSNRCFALATVINFPQGNQDPLRCIKDVEKALILGAQEIDYVFPYSQYLEGNKNKALEQCASLRQTCTEKGLALKIILETAAFSELETIYQVSKELIAIGCDFLKTSTGKITQGATLGSVLAILSAIKDSEKPCGIKISGNVKTTEQAQHYAYLAELMLEKKINKSWFRLGASSLLDALLKQAKPQRNPH